MNGAIFADITVYTWSWKANSSDKQTDSITRKEDEISLARKVWKIKDGSGFERCIQKLTFTQVCMSCKVKIQCSPFNPLDKDFAFQRTFLKVKRSCLETCTTPCLHTGWCACQRGRDVQAWTTCGSALHTGPAEYGNLGSQTVTTAISSTIRVYCVIRLDI